MLGGVSYPNNSVVQFDSIYNTPDHCHSLLCMTDRVPCCSNRQSGNWYNVQPNGTFISVSWRMKSKQDNYYQSRENDGTIRLIRQAGATQLIDSSYCCQLLDATSTTQTLCVTIGKLTLPDKKYYKLIRAYKLIIDPTERERRHVTAILSCTFIVVKFKSDSGL